LITIVKKRKTLEKLKDKEWLKTHQTVTSVMEYDDVNVTADPKLQGKYFNSSIGAYDYLAIEYGYKVIKNTWISFGYNFAGFTDPDFSAADYTAHGIYVKVRAKFDQFSARQLLTWWENRANVGGE